MSSKAKRTKIIRANKAKPNRKNLKADAKRILKNRELLAELASGR